MTILKFTSRYNPDSAKHCIIKEHITHWIEYGNNKNEKYTTIYFAAGDNYVSVKETSKEVENIYSETSPVTF